jgi:hypothetical protein
MYSLSYTLHDGHGYRTTKTSYVSRLTTEGSLTLEFIQTEFSRSGMARWSDKQIFKAMLGIMPNLRARRQIGLPRAAILAGITTLGPAFTTA